MLHMFAGKILKSSHFWLSKNLGCYTSQPHLAPPSATWLPSTSLICRNTLPSESMHWWKVNWLINDPEWKYKDPWSHHPTVSDQMHKNVHTHGLHHLEVHRTEDGGLNPQWQAGQRPHPIARWHLVSEPPHSASHARKHTEDQSYVLIYGGSIKGKRRDVTRIDGVAVE
jgi:hypothetical protein